MPKKIVSLNMLGLGLQGYEKIWKLQKRLVKSRRKGEISDTLLLVEHRPVITFGKNEKWNRLHVAEEELAEREIDFHKIERGGGATYHGPGHLTIYPIVKLSLGDLKEYLIGLEQMIIETTKGYGISLSRHDEINPTTNKPYRAVWYFDDKGRRKICAMGISISGGVSYHGLDLYVNDVDENSAFDLIDPCGFPKEEVTPITMEEILGRRLDLEEVASKVVGNFVRIFGYDSVREEAVTDVVSLS